MKVTAPSGRTLFAKVWDDHVIHDFGGGDYLLHVDRHWLNDAGYNALDALDRRGLSVRNPELSAAVVDHLLDTSSGRTYASPTPYAEEWALGTRRACDRHGIRFIGIDDRRHGISHLVSAELGMTLPGTLIVCTDSHTCTNGAFGAYACGVGSFGATQVLATQCLIARRPRTMRVTFTGTANRAATAKDLVLHLIGTHRATGGHGHAVEFAGPVIERMSMDSRMTVANMGVEFGAATAMIAPDEETFAYLRGREFAPSGQLWEDAVAYWRTLPSDENAEFDAELELGCEGLGPQVTWGTSPSRLSESATRCPIPPRRSTPRDSGPGGGRSSTWAWHPASGSTGCRSRLRSSGRAPTPDSTTCARQRLSSRAAAWRTASARSVSRGRRR